jgi:hypothetical protein
VVGTKQGWPSKEECAQTWTDGSHCFISKEKEDKEVLLDMPQIQSQYRGLLPESDECENAR